MFHLCKAPRRLETPTTLRTLGIHSKLRVSALHVSLHILWHNEQDFTTNTTPKPPRTKKLKQILSALWMQDQRRTSIWPCRPYTHAKMSEVGQGSYKLFEADFSCLTSLALQLKHVMRSCSRRIRMVLCDSDMTLADSGLIVTAGFCHCIHEVCQVLPKAGVKNPAAVFMASTPALQSHWSSSHSPEMDEMDEMDDTEKGYKQKKSSDMTSWRHDVTSHLSTSRYSHLVASESSSPITSTSVWASPDVFAPMCQAKLQFEPIELQEHTCLKFIVFRSCHLSVFWFC